MPTQNVFRWMDGRGWLVLSGGNTALGAVRATAIERVSADGAMACVSLGNPAAADALLEDMQELGGPSGYLVDALAEDDETIKTQVGDASLVVLSSELRAREVQSLVMGAVIEGVKTAYERGAVILAEGGAASVFGAYIADDGQITDGLDWLHEGVVLPQATSATESPFAQAVLDDIPQSIVIGVAVGSALALGGDGMIETWGAHSRLR